MLGGRFAVTACYSNYYQILMLGEDTFCVVDVVVVDLFFNGFEYDVGEHYYKKAENRAAQRRNYRNKRVECENQLQPAEKQN